MNEFADASIDALRVHNPSGKPVLVVEGEHFIGSKANRSVNTSALVPALADVRISASSLEGGRWGGTGTVRRDEVFTTARVRAANVRGVVPVVSCRRAELAFTLDMLDVPWNWFTPHWNIRLPPENIRERHRGQINAQGWPIWFLFGKDDDGEYLDYYAMHRMTNDRHIRLHADGREASLEAMPPFGPVIYTGLETRSDARPNTGHTANESAKSSMRRVHAHRRRTLAQPDQPRAPARPRCQARRGQVTDRRLDRPCGPSTR